MWTRANHKESQGIHHPRRESDGSVFRHRHQVIPISLFIPLNVISSDFWPSFWLFLISMRSSRKNRKLTSFNKWNFIRNHRIVYKFDMHVLHTNDECELFAGTVPFQWLYQLQIGVTLSHADWCPSPFCLPTWRFWCILSLALQVFLVNVLCSKVYMWRECDGRTNYSKFSSFSVAKNFISLFFMEHL